MVAGRSRLELGNVNSFQIRFPSTAKRKESQKGGMETWNCGMSVLISAVDDNRTKSAINRCRACHARTECRDTNGHISVPVLHFKMCSCAGLYDHARLRVVVLGKVGSILCFLLSLVCQFLLFVVH
ncbi:hypothetical protein RHSIM_Rhsim12G0184200 [Rhododendron simsii]|uniref:Uncharacterized protein n=1 Tax=Rhododendron simsii TaxID=118357 RepID=A0A834G520_RHOSS|nr:hypothetical protein RHSIM_Rhsim12G0184200 [Rhododendron simsii]